MVTKSYWITTCTLDHSKGTNALALDSTYTFDHSIVTGKSSSGVSVLVVKLLLLTLRVCNDLSYTVPAAPPLSGQPKLSPPAHAKEMVMFQQKIVKISGIIEENKEKKNTKNPDTKLLNALKHQNYHPWRPAQSKEPFIKTQILTQNFWML